METTPTRALGAILIGIGLGTTIMGTLRIIGQIDDYLLSKEPTAAREIYHALDIDQTVQIQPGETTITRLEDALSVKTNTYELIDFGANGTPDIYITVSGEIFELTTSYHKPLNDYLREIKNGN